MTRESLSSENRNLRQRCPALFLMCNRTLGTTGPHFQVHLLLTDHSQVEAALRSQRKHHPLHYLLPEAEWGHHALQVRLLPARYITSVLVSLQQRSMDPPICPQHSCSLSSLLPPYRNESAVTYAYTPRRWRRPEGEPNGGARWEGPLLRLPQNRDAAEERGRRVWIPQDLWELPPQWSVWTQVHDTTRTDAFITVLAMASAGNSLDYIFI